MGKNLGLGLIGLGRLGSSYAKYLTGRIAGARLVAVSDVNEAAAVSLTAQLGISKRYSRYQDLIADEEVEAVVIVSPTSTHKEIVLEAAKYDKAIFCEKPLSISLAEARAMHRAVEQAGVFFQMGFMRRFDKGYVAAKRKIEEGAIGTPVVFKSSSRDPNRPSLEYLDPTHSGGLLVDCGIHDFDLARWFMGDIASVYSIGGTLAYPEMKEIGDIDNAITSLYFLSGALGVIDLSRNGVYGYDIRTEILGTEGTIKIGYLRETPILVMTKEGICHDTVPYFTERFEQAYITQLQDFVENVLRSKPPAVSCADGVAALQASAAATLSFNENRPVRIQETSSPI
ncbi:MAG TPA: inositol 2-dehydrogenase [Blastocatellia bacterium]|jgi:inositol 2-dehydrogenase|nr:inositol 2-dehydrogenase [Blastocatellia bacterium]HAF23304.1 inositol 2-dehydrogenase [Blastocatellia bacterium]HCX31410.1 inositol 2-dehydrogenase [Blastocatellia bacterium]